MTPDQEEKLDRIHELLAGTLEKKGLAHKVLEMEVTINDLKKYKEKDENLKAKLAGGVAVSIPALTWFWNWLTK